MASMNTCPEELRAMFVDYVHALSPRTLSSLALTNKSFRRLVMNRRFRTWECRHGNLRKDLKEIQERGVQKAIRHVSLIDHMVPKPEFRVLLPKMEALQSIEILCGSIHPGLVMALFEYLMNRPQIRLNLTVSPGSIRHLPNTVGLVRLGQFEGCRNLHSLTVKFQYQDRMSCLEMNGHLKRILLTCATLRHLTLDIKRDEHYGLNPLPYCGLGFINGERPLAPLETLEVIAYPFGKKDNVHPFLYQPNVSEYPSIGYEQLYWVENFNWSNLTRLNIRDTWAWVPHANKLTSLKEVDLTRDHCNGFASKFLQNVPTKLESIKVHQLERFGWKFFTKHGSSLRVLHITGDGTGPQWLLQNMTMDYDTLENIRSICPYIEDLGISFIRDDVYPEEILMEIAQFRRVCKVTLYFDYTLQNFNIKKLEPAITFRGASKVLEYLDLYSEGSEYYPLRELRLVSGIFRPPKNIYDPHEVPRTARDAWVKDSQITIICTAPERDDQTIHDLNYITCPELTEDENEILDLTKESGLSALWHVDRSSTDPRLKKVSPKFKVAWAGPLAYSQWEDYCHWVYRPGGTRYFRDVDFDYVIEDEDDLNELRRTRPNHPSWNHT
ncbi:hypothetical protein F4805DRAFT_472577 [Annulohypoxylon moriforme]|nr:hypothetical protein F4805DRAFT_472577 [Annulohypoxylon moriforme]